MNQMLQDFARSHIKDGLAKLPSANRMVFKLMYSHDDLSRCIFDVVDNMPADKLDHAMVQVQKSVDMMSSE